MQTFLPYPNFRQTASCLDNLRLGKQRVEAYQIYRVVSGERTTGGWLNHPAVLMWKGYPEALAFYHNIMVAEWVSRGRNNNMPMLPEGRGIHSLSPDALPAWLGDPRLHMSHQSNLLRKDLEFYSQYGWEPGTDMPYYWPITKNRGYSR